MCLLQVLLEQGADPRIHADDGAVPQQVGYVAMLCMHWLVTLVDNHVFQTRLIHSVNGLARHFVEIIKKIL